MNQTRGVSGSCLNRGIAVLLGIGFLFLPARDGKAQTASSRDRIPMALVQPSAEMPRYELSSLRLEKGPRGRTQLVFDFTQKQPGKYILVDVVARLGKSSTGEKLFRGLDAGLPSPYRAALGEDIAAKIREQGVEVFVIAELMSSRRIGNRLSDVFYRFKLSNSVTLGDARQQATARGANDDERKRIASWLEFVRQQGPKYESVPEGYTLFSKAKSGRPGMKAKVFDEGQWKPCEYLGEDDSDQLVYRPDPASREVKTAKAINLAVLDADIAKLSVDMRSIVPSIELVPGLAQAIPEGFTINRYLYRLVPGTPIKIRDGNRLIDGFVVSQQYKTVTLRSYDVPNGMITLPTEHVMMTPQVLAWIKSGEAKERFPKYLEPDNTVSPLRASGLDDPNPYPPKLSDATEPATVESAAAMPQDIASNHPPAAAATVTAPAPATVERKLKRYPIKLAVPRGMSVVNQEMPLQAGIKLGCSWGSKWYFVTVLDLHDDGAVRVRWDDFGQAWDTDVPREDLIVADKLLRTLKQKASAAEARPRMWTDVTGKFTVLAYLVRVDGIRVTLRKPDGKEVALPLEKLSEPDRAILASP